MVVNLVPTLIGLRQGLLKSPRRRLITEQVGCSGRQLACALDRVEAQSARWCVDCFGVEWPRAAKDLAVAGASSTWLVHVLSFPA